MNDFYRLGHVVGRLTRLVRPLVIIAALGLVAYGMYDGATQYRAFVAAGSK